MSEREPDHTEDPRGTDSGAGYPEDQPAGAGEATQREDPPEQEKGGAGEDAPSTSASQEREPEQATGNPESG